MWTEIYAYPQATAPGGVARYEMLMWRDVHRRAESRHLPGKAEAVMAAGKRRWRMLKGKDLLTIRM